MCKGKCAVFYFGLLTFLAFINNAVAQRTNVEVLRKISEQEQFRSELKKTQLTKVADSLNLELVISLTPDKSAYLVDFVEGFPWYMSTHNLQARRTTGVETLQSLNLDIPLLGQTMTIGVWDGGLVLSDHVEFDSRVVNITGSNFSNHATHVTGTIAASGINPQAKGMMPMGKVRAFFGLGTDDLSLMANEASQGMVLSNHSYGFVLGWEFENNTWIWRGDTETVDTRFGDYNSYSRSQDEIAYNAPYYTIVRSAGNDRNDTGDGSRPADGPFDCIGPSATSKNVITVGAINGFNAYNGPSTVIMSNFSGWGPTDDGRIKPDVVGDGVGVISTSSSGVQSYTTLQGTSMAAPNVTGSIALLQQYYRQKADTFMTAAALKALVIHTAYEAGLNPGPDYVYGWGVVNVVDAYKVLSSINGSDTLLIQETLLTGQQDEYKIFSDGRTPIVATIAWTDPPGIPSTIPGDKKPMLINDLDIRLVDNEGNEVRPWVLNPDNPSALAVKADNILDNVEQIELITPDPGIYTLVVSHKGSLFNSKQPYGLILTGSAIKANDIVYWRASHGSISDPNWSYDSDGAANPAITPNGKTWVFDSNTNLLDGDVIQLNDQMLIDNLIWTSDKNGIIDLGGHELTINHDIIISNPNLVIRNGKLKVNASMTPDISLKFNGSDNCSVIVLNSTPVELSIGLIDSLSFYGGDVLVKDQNEATIGTLQLLNSNTQFLNSQIKITRSFNLSNDNYSFDETKWVFDNSLIQHLNEGSIVRLDDLIFEGSNSVSVPIISKTALFSDVISLYEDFITDELTMNEGAVLTVSAEKNIEVNGKFTFQSDGNSNTYISGQSSVLPSKLKLNFRDLICISHLSMENIEVEIDGVFNCNPCEISSNVVGVFSLDCDELILPNFAIERNCANSKVHFINNSIGPINNFEWDFGNGLTNETVTNNQNPVVVYNAPGLYLVKLKVSNSQLSITYEKEIEIVNNPLPPISILNLQEGLVGSISQSSYIWFLNGVEIQGQSTRILKPQETGTYQVGYVNNGSSCGNRISDPFVYEIVTNNENVEFRETPTKLYPNPTNEFVTIEHSSGLRKIEVLDYYGKVILKYTLDNPEQNAKVDMSQLTSSLYFVRLFDIDGTILLFKIFKQ